MPQATGRRKYKARQASLHIRSFVFLLIYFDYKRKVIGFGPLHKIGDDIDVEMADIRVFYASIYARHPEKACSEPTGAELQHQ